VPNRVSWASEILVIDNGSTDKTTKLPENIMPPSYRCRPKVFTITHSAKTHTACEWLLYIDADEIVSESLERKLKIPLANLRYPAYTLNGKIIITATTAGRDRKICYGL